MWNRKTLKQRAKSVLRVNYWEGLGATAAVVGLSEAPVFLFIIPLCFAGIFFASMASNGTPDEVFPFVLLLYAIMYPIIIAAAILYIQPLMTGLYHYFNRAAGMRAKISDIFFGFRRGNYPKVMGAMAWRLLFIFLWTLLFYVPGIIKSISYSMVPFILSDNPRIGARRAMKLSMAMTKGYKWRIFVLGLSFLGWFLLGMLAAGIGVVFVEPYLYATMAELYAVLRARAIEAGITTVEELNLGQIA